MSRNAALHKVHSINLKPIFNWKKRRLVFFKQRFNHTNLLSNVFLIKLRQQTRNQTNETVLQRKSSFRICIISQV